LRAEPLEQRDAPALFSPGQAIGVGTWPIAVLSADFNGDGHADLAVANENDSTVSIFLGNGTGQFASAAGSPVSTVGAPSSLAAADVNGDGHLDLFVMGAQLEVLIGDGHGSFTAGSTISLGSSPRYMAAGDFNNDGKPDCVVVDEQDNNARVLLGNGSGGFTQATGSPIAVGNFPTWVSVGDFNRDTKLDFAVSNAGSGTVGIFLGNGNGQFTQASGSPITLGGISPYPESLAVADFNLDGSPDLAVLVNERSGSSTGDYVQVLLGDGSGGFSFAPVTYRRTLVDSIPILAGDFNGDGRPDIALAVPNENSLQVILGDGTGRFSLASGSSFATIGMAFAVASGDFNGDGRLDLAVTAQPFALQNPPPGSMHVLLNNGGNGHLVRLQAVGAGPGGTPQVKVYNSDGSQRMAFLAYASSFAGGVSVATGDVSGDDVEDIVTGAGPGGGPHVEVFDGKTGNLIRSFFAYDPSFTGGVHVAAADINGDGYADIITGAGPGGGPHVKAFDGRTGALVKSFFAYDASFTGGVFVAAGDNMIGGGTAAGADGFADIITGPGPGGAPEVRDFNHNDQSGVADWSFMAYPPTVAGGVSVAAADVNGDGIADIITGAGPGGGPHVKVFDRVGNPNVPLASFFAYSSSFAGGVNVAAEDVNGDGIADIITGAGPGGGPHVKVFDGKTGNVIRSFFAFDPGFIGGVFVG
jgi:hypothetical protein